MVINIKLCDGWRLLTDKNNWIIGKEDGDRLSYEGFYSSLEGAIQGFVEKKIRGFDSTSLLALNNSIKSLEIAFYKSLQVLKLEKEGKK